MLGNEQAAAEELEKAAEAFADNADMLYEVGLLYEQIDPERAIEFYAKARRLDPRQEEAAARQAGLLIEAGNTDEAHAVLASAVEDIPDSRALRLAYARELVRAGDAASAREVVRNPEKLWENTATAAWDEVCALRPADDTVLSFVGPKRLRIARHAANRWLGRMALRHRILASELVLEDRHEYAAARYISAQHISADPRTGVRLADLTAASGTELQAMETYVTVDPAWDDLLAPRVERWQQVGFEQFSEEMQAFIAGHQQAYTLVGEVPVWEAPID